MVNSYLYFAKQQAIQAYGSIYSYEINVQFHTQPLYEVDRRVAGPEPFWKLQR
jgi:hypothetical protein